MTQLDLGEYEISGCSCVIILGHGLGRLRCRRLVVRRPSAFVKSRNEFFGGSIVITSAVISFDQDGRSKA